MKFQAEFHNVIMEDLMTENEKFMQVAMLNERNQSKSKWSL